ncbi:MAG TPA: aminotransferase class V-fold PLP-dependent enzyme [Isosphaeraceae bacterium]|jgi:kynureninase|nr:aminotransferase class V-fold PLP-dependent enzyme [Isosphaeraceae bacterium]
MTITPPLGAADDPLLAYRGRFPIVDRTNYLISNSLGAVPHAVEESLHSYYETWATRGVRAWEESWWGLVAELGDLVAPLIGAGKGEVVFQPNVTIAHAVLFSAFDFRDGRPKVVTDAMHFPSILYLLAEQQSLGAEVVVVPTDDGITVDAGRLVDAIDETTAFVAVSHVLFKSSYVHDIASIAEKARKVGAILIVDGYQAVGNLPVDVGAIGADVYIGGCLKWLCGGPGAAFLWVRPDLRTRFAPRLAGWMAHSNPFSFATTLDRRPDAWRFLHGTPNIPAFYAARPGLEIIAEVGIDAIRAKSGRQTARLLALADAFGFPCTTPRDPSRRGGTVAIDAPHGPEVSRALKSRDILCDYRPGAGIRLSPHLYNRDDELDAAVTAIAQTLESREWEAFGDAKVVS